MDERDVFELAAEHMRTAKLKISQEDQLKLYGLFKQGSVGPCSVPKPGMLDFVGKAKWEAWNTLGQMEGGEAMQKYVQLVDTLIPGWKEKALTACGTSSAVKSAEDEDPDDLLEREEGDGCSGDGGAKGLAPRVSTLQLEDSSDEGSKSDLCYFASVNDLEAVQKLLAQGTDINYQDEEGQTALHFAADRGNVELMQVLLKAGANVDARAKDGQTPIHYAAAADYLQACKLLKEAGADLTIEDEDGTTALDLTTSLDIQLLFDGPVV